MVGYSASDEEASRDEGADFFVCCGGVVLRDNVCVQADWLVMHVKHVKTLIDSLNQDLW